MLSKRSNQLSYRDPCIRNEFLGLLKVRFQALLASTGFKVESRFLVFSRPQRSSQRSVSTDPSFSPFSTRTSALFSSVPFARPVVLIRCRDMNQKKRKSSRGRRERAGEAMRRRESLRERGASFDLKLTSSPFSLWPLSAALVPHQSLCRSHLGLRIKTTRGNRGN